MSDESKRDMNTPNRSSAPTPEVIAGNDAIVKAAVQEAIAGVFAQIGPFLKDMQLTPERLRDAMKPWVDPAVEKRQLREKMKFKEEEKQNAVEQRRQKDNCSHHYKNGLLAVALVNNFHDRQTRGVCMKCHEWIHPREWRIDEPTEHNPHGKAHVVEQHKLYHLVVEAANQQQG
jgi:hypothetical protein